MGLTWAVVRLTRTMLNAVIDLGGDVIDWGGVAIDWGVVAIRSGEGCD